MPYIGLGFAILEKRTITFFSWKIYSKFSFPLFFYFSDGENKSQRSVHLIPHAIQQIRSKFKSINVIKFNLTLIDWAFTTDQALGSALYNLSCFV